MRKVDKIATYNKETMKAAHTRSGKVKENIPNKHEFMFNRELQIVIRKDNIENGKQTYNKETMKAAHIRSGKVKENIPNKHEFMFNRELQIVIRKDNIEDGKQTYLKSSDSCRSTRDNASNKLHQKQVTRSEKAKKENTNELELKLKESTENEQNYSLTTISQKLNSNSNIDKSYQNCIVKLIRLKTQQDEKRCVLKDLNTSNIGVGNATRIIVESSCDVNRRPNGYSSDSFDECTISKRNASIIANTISKFDTLEASIVRCDGDDEDGISKTNFTKASAIIHSSIFGIKTSTPLRSSDTMSPFVKRLRNNEKKNYRESSLSLTEPLAEAPFEDPSGKKVPVYKRIIVDHHKPKADLYEFDDAEFDIQYRRKNKHTSEKFDKTMHSILEKLEKKEKTKKNMKKRNNDIVNRRVPVYEIKVNAAMEKVMDKIKAKRYPLLQNGLVSKNNNNCKKNNENEPEIQNKLIGDKNKNKNCQIKSQNDAIAKDNRRNTIRELNKNNTQQQEILCNGYNNELNKGNNVVNRIIDTENVINIKQNKNYSDAVDTDDDDEDNSGDNCFEHTPEPVDVNNLTLHSFVKSNSTHPSDNNMSDNSNLSEFYGFSNTKSMLVLDRSDDTDSFQEFDAAEESKVLPKSSLITNHLSSTLGKKDTSINLLGNVLLRPAQRNVIKKVASCDYFVDLHENYTFDNNFGFDYNENADSSMMAHAGELVRPVWRFADIIKRNPHFLFIKSNALPCLNQDLIIDYALVEWIETHAAVKHSNNPQTIKDAPAKVTYQKKMLEYIECSVNLENNSDNEVFSSSLYDYEEFHVPVKPRRVFGILQSEQVISTPKRHVETSIHFPDVSIIKKYKENSNGSNIENAENTPPEHTLQIRAGIHEIRKYSKKSKNKQDVVEKENRRQQQLIDSDDDSDVTEDKKQNITNDDKGGDELQLFDEDEPELLENVSITIPKMNYPSKRRKRLKSDGLDMDEDGKSKKKKKDMMTKEEEIEFEKWASKFNAMCEEVENYELEVD